MSNDEAQCINEALLKELCELSKYYRENFLPAYADVVVILNAKPDETLLEIENIHSHIIQILNPEISDDKKIENISKAKGHIERATLDCLKIIWTEFGNTLSNLNKDEAMRRYCVNMPEHEFVKKYVEYSELLSKARRAELDSVGTSHSTTIDAYKNAIELAKDLLKSVDHAKMTSLDPFRKIIKIKTNLVSFLLGVASSLVACLIWGANLIDFADYIRKIIWP